MGSSRSRCLFKKNKYSFVQVKDGGTYFFGAYEFLGFTQPMDAYYEHLKQQGFRILTLPIVGPDYESSQYGTTGARRLSDEIKDNTKKPLTISNLKVLR